VESEADASASVIGAGATANEDGQAIAAAATEEHLRAMAIHPAHNSSLVRGLPTATMMMCLSGWIIPLPIRDHSPTMWTTNSGDDPVRGLRLT
jgi:hypothetical protein